MEIHLTIEMRLRSHNELKKAIVAVPDDISVAEIIDSVVNHYFPNANPSEFELLVDARGKQANGTLLTDGTRIILQEKSAQSVSIWLDGSSTTPAPSPTLSSKPKLISCSKCNSSNPREAMFCMKCGAQLASDSSTDASSPLSSGEPDFLYCPQCGSPNPPGAKFCGSCGTLLPGDFTTEAPPPDVSKKKKPRKK